MNFLKNVSQKGLEAVSSGNQIIQLNSQRYELLGLIAEGGYGFVYKAKNLQTQKICAVKKLRVQTSTDRRDIKKEINIQKKLKNCKNVVDLYGSLESNDSNGNCIFVIMEYCPKSLIDEMNRLLKRKTYLGEEQAIKIFYPVCNAVRTMHELSPPISHRDIKVENVLISSSNTFKLCDFGSATATVYDLRDQKQKYKAEEDIEKNTTLSYRAPEMIDLYRKQKIDTKVDIWALGCLLYKILYFKDCFDEETELQILNEAYSFPKNPKYSKRIIKFIKWMLTPDPKKRPNIDQVMEHVEENWDLQIKTQKKRKKKSSKKLKKKHSLSKSNSKSKFKSKQNPKSESKTSKSTTTQFSNVNQKTQINNYNNNYLNNKNHFHSQSQNYNNSQSQNFNNSQSFLFEQPKQTVQIQETQQYEEEIDDFDPFNIGNSTNQQQQQQKNQNFQNNSENKYGQFSQYNQNDQNFNNFEEQNTTETNFDPFSINNSNNKQSKQQNVFQTNNNYNNNNNSKFNNNNNNNKSQSNNNIYSQMINTNLLQLTNQNQASNSNQDLSLEEQMNKSIKNFSIEKQLPKKKTTGKAMRVQVTNNNVNNQFTWNTNSNQTNSQFNWNTQSTNQPKNKRDQNYYKAFESTNNSLQNQQSNQNLNYSFGYQNY
ncbi:numb-associated kinase isoform a [Anaeramoeba flamelloides]|uniref:non-specific serine/threonine protein kinase n=1 Tax=Anaeramoeba flamelloides TaxID=1746091 RepID=A0AAV7YGD5_9EUKA|nr:numb-associated kinase isoform a [Anaeramoeba flamelloides]